MMLCISKVSSLSLIVVLIAFSMGTSPAFAQTVDFIEITEKKIYSDNTCITVIGKVNSVLLDIPIILQVYGPNGNLIEIRQLDVDSDKLFNANFVPNGNLWKHEGDYTMKITYNKYTFDGVLYVSDGPTYTSPSNPIPFVFEDKKYFFMDDPDINNVSVDNQNNSIFYKLSREKTPCNEEDSYLHSIMFQNPNLIDYDDKQDRSVFIVQVNGDITKYDIPDITTSSTSSIETITFLVPYDTANVEITVVKVIPEFGILTILILGIAIFTAIIIFRIKSPQTLISLKQSW